MKQINLEEILNKVIWIETKSDTFKQEILNAMKEACNQTVDLCVENAAINFIDLTSDKVFDYSECLVDDDVDVVINKDSILNTKNQIV